MFLPLQPAAFAWTPGIQAPFLCSATKSFACLLAFGVFLFIRQLCTRASNTATHAGSGSLSRSEPLRDRLVTTQRTRETARQREASNTATHAGSGCLSGSVPLRDPRVTTRRESVRSDAKLQTHTAKHTGSGRLSRSVPLRDLLVTGGRSLCFPSPLICVFERPPFAPIDENV